MITKFELYNESINFNLKLITSLFPILYKKAIKNIINIHQSLSEDHILEFINHYISNTYGVDLPNSKEIYNYVKYLVHKNFIHKNDNMSESLMSYTFTTSGMTSKKYYLPTTPIDSRDLFIYIRTLDIIKTKNLLKQGADVNIQDKNFGRTPLIKLILGYSHNAEKIIKMIKILVKYGVDLDIQDYNGCTALMAASGAKYIVSYPIMYELIELGANWNIKTLDNKDFIDILKTKYPEKFKKYLIKKEIDKYNL